MPITLMASSFPKPCPLSCSLRTRCADPRFLNIRLDGIRVEDPERYPHMVSAALTAQQDDSCRRLVRQFIAAGYRASNSADPSSP